MGAEIATLTSWVYMYSLLKESVQYGAAEELVTTVSSGMCGHTSSASWTLLVELFTTGEAIRWCVSC